MPSSPAAEIARIFRYPVKGLSAEPLKQVRLEIGQTLPADRRYAIENGDSGFDPEAPRWMPKTQFLMLMRNERLAALETRFEDARNLLTIRQDGNIVLSADLETPEGRDAVAAFFREHFAPELRGQPKVLSGGGHSFSDVARKVVSIINLASLREIEEMVCAPVHPVRFRANLYVSGWPAWYEAGLLGQTLAVGSARLKVVKKITRCAAVDVDPETARRDLQIPAALMRRFGHNECGIYAEVVAAGSVRVGDAVSAEQPQLM